MSSSSYPSSPAARRSAWPLARVDRSGVALGSLALVGLHVADDAFLHPEPGTAALRPPRQRARAARAARPRSRGLAPRTRRRPGHRRARRRPLRARDRGASAGYETITVGPSGDDYTGLLAVPAGLALVAIGVATLWRSRKLHDSRRRRYTRRTLIVVAAAAAVNFVLMPVGFGYVTTHVLRQSVPEAKLGGPYENVSFRTSDGLELHGWYVPSENGAAVIAIPGRSGPRAHTRMLARHGYGVLLFDRRGEGESEGASNLFGWGGDEDILAAIEFLKGPPRRRAGSDRRHRPLRRR